MCDGIIVTAIAVERKLDIIFFVTYPFCSKTNSHKYDFYVHLFKLKLSPPYTNSQILYFDINVSKLMYQNSDFATIVNVEMQRYYVKMQKADTQNVCLLG